jgi:Arc/MetJ-type ribon-helix-helix transcriptional regulator
MYVRLTPEQEKIIENEIKEGRFHSIEEVIAEGLLALRAKQASAPAAPSNSAQHEAVREMRAFVETNRVRLQGILVKRLLHNDR